MNEPGRGSAAAGLARTAGLLFGLLPALSGLASGLPIPDLDEHLDAESAARIRHDALDPERVAGLLITRPAMDAAVIEADPGLFAFPLARALQGTGRVFAAEADAETIGRLNQTIAEQSYKNVSTVLVRRDRVDDFYRQHEFDLILTDRYQDLIDPVAFFQELRPALKKETGRLCLVYAKLTPDLNELEFGDFKPALQALAAKGPRFPVNRRLGEQSRASIAAWKGEPLSSAAKARIVADLNALLVDRFLFPDLKDFYHQVPGSGGGLRENLYPSQDEDLYYWLAKFLDNEGAFDPGIKAISPTAVQQLRRFNRLLLMGILRTQIFDQAILPGGLILDSASVVRDLKKAGYTLAAEDSRSLSYFHILQFQREH